MPRMLLYASEVLEARDIAVSAEVAPGLDHVKLDMQSRRDLYLIFKEAVNNLAKYSAATHVNITMRLQGNRLTLVISDNGIGFDPSVTSAGNGLKNMKERAEKHHWDLNIQASPGTGTTITLQAAVA